MPELADEDLNRRLRQRVEFLKGLIETDLAVSSRRTSLYESLYESRWVVFSLLDCIQVLKLCHHRLSLPEHKVLPPAFPNVNASERGKCFTPEHLKWKSSPCYVPSSNI